MKYRRWLRGAKFWFWVAIFVAYSATAAGILMIDTRQALDQRYQRLSNVETTTVHSSADARRAGAAQAAALYRARSGMPFTALPPGTRFQIVWPDGSTETVMTVSPTSTLGAEPVADTQQDAPQR